MKTMLLQNLRIHKTNEVVTHYSGELIDANDHLYVNFSISAGSQSAIAYDIESGYCYDIIEINGSQNFDLSTWRDGDSIKIFTRVNKQ